MSEDLQEAGFDQFLRRPLEQQPLSDRLVRLYESSLGPAQQFTLPDAQDRLPKTATSAVDSTQIVGTITATTVADGSITTPKLAANSVTAAKITAGTITATELAAGSVTAAKISVANLAAINATLGSVSAGTITGSTLQTGTSGENVNITSAYISVRNSGSELGYFKSVSGTYAGTELKTDAIYLGGGLSYILGNSSGITMSTDSGSKSISINGQAGVTITGGAGVELTSGGLFDLLLNNNTTVVIPTSAGTPTGGSSGSMKLDTTNSKIYFKVGSTWKFAALT